jgi:SAM-dependent methyltransferase
MSMQNHWERVYQTRAPLETSWYTPHLDTSLRLIREAAASPSAAILDVGGGVSTLVDDLLAAGYVNVTVLDISRSAIVKSKRRLGDAAERAHWIAGDITRIELPPRSYDVWHDRGTFHFLAPPSDRAAYLDRLRTALRPGGHLILATFALAGPERCSDLPVERYDAAGLQRELGPEFRLVASLLEQHTTPGGTTQPFQYGHFVMG